MNVAVLTGSQRPTCPKFDEGARIDIIHTSNACSQGGALEQLRAKTAELGYDGIFDAKCVEPGLVGHENCGCSAIPFKCKQ